MNEKSSVNEYVFYRKDMTRALKISNILLVSVLLFNHVRWSIDSLNRCQYGYLIFFLCTTLLTLVLLFIMIYGYFLKKDKKIYFIINTDGINILKNKSIDKNDIERIYIPKYGGGLVEIDLLSGKKVKLDLNFIDTNQREFALKILRDYIT